jgi:hypothetical protein
MPRKRKGGDQGRKGGGKRERAPEPVAREDAQPRAERPAGPATPPAPGLEEQEYTELVLLVHAANMVEAELFKTELSAHGIPAFLEGEGAGVAGIPDVGAGVPVLVPEEFADQAAELIAELESAKPEGNALAEKENIFEDEDVEEADEVDEVEDLDDEDAEEEEDEDPDDEDDLDEEDDDWEEEDEEEEEAADEEEDEDWEDEDEDDEEDEDDY